MRSMALESIFEEKFNIALDIAYLTGLKGAWVQGVGTGLMNGMIYFVEGESISTLRSASTCVPVAPVAHTARHRLTHILL